MNSRRVLVGIGAVTLLALVLRTWGVRDQVLTPDDLDVGRTAANYLGSGWPGPTMWNHPRLRDLLVGAALPLAELPVALRLWSIVLGTLAVPATAAFVLATGSGAAAALGAALLLAVDPLHVGFSRQGINDVFLSCFPVAALAATLRYRATRAPGWLAGAGLLFGLALASKWIAAVPLGLAIAVVARDAWRRTSGGRERTAELAFAAAALVLLPAALYVATWLPWFARGHDAAEWVTFHRAMAVETATHVGYEGTKRPGFEGELVGAWRWFLGPSYYVDEIPPGSPPAFLPRGTRLVEVANPVALLAVLPALGLALWRALRARTPGPAWLAAGFLGSYLPFAAATRPIWTNSLVTVLPWAAALVGAALPVRRPALAGAFLAAAVAAGALLWFPATATPFGPGDRLARALVPASALERGGP